MIQETINTKCRMCEQQIYIQQRHCDGCDASLCYMCCNFVNTGGVTTRWCDDCYSILEPAIDLPGSRSYTFKRSTKSERVTFGAGLYAHTSVVISPSQKWLESLEVGDPFHVNIEPTVFVQMIRWLLQENEAEIAGHAVWDEASNSIVWSYLDEQAKGSPGGVHSGSADATVAAMLAGRGVPNVQWHTHPGFSAYFSGTDDNDQMRFVDEASKLSSSGYYIFLVFDRTEWTITRYDWRDHKPATKRDGHVMLDGQPLDYGGYSKWNWQGKNSNGVTIYNYTVKDDDDEPYSQLLLPATAQKIDADYDPHLNYRGTWSDHDESYDYLFDRLTIPRYSWVQLYDEIGRLYGYTHYRTIIEDQSLWENL